MKNEVTREEARQILRKGILDMNVSRLIQMSHFGLMGNIVLSNKMVCVENAFNHISYDEKSNVITFSVEESQASYGAIAFLVNAVVEILGCEDKENPEDYLNVEIKLENDTTVIIKVLY